MADRPILFSAPMVKAILREIEQPGTGKTVTRRTGGLPTLEQQPNGLWHVHTRHGGALNVNETDIGSTAAEMLRIEAGDRLWVREAHALLPRTAYRGSVGTGTIAQREHPTDGYTAAVFREGFDRSGRPPWRPSIHMPRWASRITLLVTGVKVERLQDISDDDARAEGAEAVDRVLDHRLSNAHKIDLAGTLSHTLGFERLWDSINGPGAWDANPWVSAITFRPVLSNIDSLGEVA